MSYKKRIWFGLIFFAGVLILHMLLSGRLISLQQIQEHRLYLENMVAQRYLFSVFAYLCLFVFSTVFGIPITVLLTVAAGYFFGPFAGIFYANIGATFGAVISFLVFRYVLGSFVQNRYAKQLKQFNQNIEANGANYLLTMQLLPVTPTFLINVFAGLTTISLWTFIWTTFVGILPGSLLYVLAGQKLAGMQTLNDLLSLPSIILLLILALFALSPAILRLWRS